MGADQRWIPQRVRHRLQRGRRTVHLRRRHGMGHRVAVVPPDPRLPRDQRQRVRLAQRHGQVAHLVPRQPAAGGRHRPGLPNRHHLRHRGQIPRQVPEGPVHFGLELRHPVRRPHATQRLNLHRHRRTVRLGRPASVDRCADQPRRRGDVLHHRGTSHAVGSLPRDLQRKGTDQGGRRQEQGRDRRAIPAPATRGHAAARPRRRHRIAVATPFES